MRRLSQECDYKDVLSDMIRDRLVVGINDVAIQRKLLSEKDLILDRAITIAVGMEKANKEAATISGASEIHEIRERRESRRQDKCFRCGDQRHKPEECIFKDKDCYFCKKKGHISKVCMAKKRSRPVNRMTSQNPDENLTTARGEEDFNSPEGARVEQENVYHIYRT